MATIRSRNAEFQKLEALKRNRKKRASRGLIFVEGVKPIDAAVANGVRIETAVVDASRRLSAWAEGIVTRAASTVSVAPELMEELSDKEEPSELVAILERPRLDPEALAPHRATHDFVWVVFDRPASEGNLGTVIRTGDALGVDAVITTGHGVDLFDPVTIRASLGAVFNLPAGHLELPDLRALLDRVPDVTICGTSARDATPLTEADFPRPLVVCLGNETSGLSRAMRELCTRMVGIEMKGVASSLNVGAAAAIVLHEVFRGR